MGIKHPHQSSGVLDCVLPGPRITQNEASRRRAGDHRRPSSRRLTAHTHHAYSRSLAVARAAIFADYWISPTRAQHSAATTKVRLTSCSCRSIVRATLLNIRSQDRYVFRMHTGRARRLEACGRGCSSRKHHAQRRCRRSSRQSRWSAVVGVVHTALRVHDMHLFS